MPERHTGGRFGGFRLLGLCLQLPCRSEDTLPDRIVLVSRELCGRERPDELVPNWRERQAERGERARKAWHEYLRNAERFGERARVQSARAPEAEQHEVRRIVTALD